MTTVFLWFWALYDWESISAQMIILCIIYCEWHTFCSYAFIAYFIRFGRLRRRCSTLLQVHISKRKKSIFNTTHAFRNSLQFFFQFVFPSNSSEMNSMDSRFLKFVNFAKYKEIIEPVFANQAIAVPSEVRLGSLSNKHDSDDSPHPARGEC